MEPNLSLVIDKLAEKINLAADNLMPIGKETLEQIVVKATAFVLIGSICTFLCLSLVVIGIVLMCKGTLNYPWVTTQHIDLDSKGVLGLALTIIFGIVLIISVSITIGQIGIMLAPLPHVLGL